MECTQGTAATDISGLERLLDDASQYNFFQLVELLKQLQNDQDFALFYAADKSLSFARSDIAGLEKLAGQPARYNLVTRFLGLNGSQSPLPNYYLDELACESEDGIKHKFFDFFNHRLTELLHLAWRKYRYYIQFEADAKDKFSAQLFSLVGLASDSMRGETPINWCKMLAYSGMLAGKNRSPQVVSGIVGHCFDLAHVQVKPWQKRYVSIADNQKCSLGAQGNALGIDSVIGDAVEDRSGKFRLVISDLTQQRFKDFLPSGIEYQPLCKLLEFVLREQLAWELELQLAEDQINPLQLNQTQPAQLGWSAFLGKVDPARKVVIQVRA
ncbi:type VI secretion system baseplate subunit TssG [Motilimonas sp. KMU-193]|uniref:type VI secretion system baseplate subunit TssG n=1 Tax=Motilimonas sp. KMU-193 TaxID=3388668 RepID=UPI00396B4628